MESSSSSSLKPDHVIIWLDKHMSVERNNRTSKIDLATNATLDDVPSNERSLDIDNLIACADEQCHNEQKLDALLKTSLHMFTDKNECLESIQEHLADNKRVFFISSGSMGALIVPDIHDLLSRFIYIFCGRITKHDWAFDYTTDLLIFDHETDLFARLLRDIAKYYISKSEKSSNQANSIEYLKWAFRLAQRANKLDQDDVKFIKTIEKHLIQLDPSQSNDNADDCRIGQNADEG
ncbi:unnamed protein product [Rotaria sordida]|uniref:Uncharacterized protein n=1 Tax=Rotaria sordida TaxID=392033 RepID=A0A814BGX2_9BILA|nr:unnamed protein product [Rotaria sordida]CAF3861784.1 unnamed protein product [Rotaria sordida]